MSKKTIGSLLVRLGMDAKDADKAIRKFETDLVRAGKRMESVGRGLSIALTLPIVGFGVASVKAASDAQETFSKFGVVFRNVATDAEKSFQTLRNEYGLSSLAAKRLLSDTGDLLTGFGFSQDSALQLSTEVNKLAVDLASFTNFSGGAEGASQALTKALLGERESVKSLGIAILESDVKARVLLNAKQGLTFETERQAKAYATLQIAQEQSKNAIGDYARTQDSFANQTRLLKSRVEDLTVEFGTIMLPVMTKVVGKLQDLVKWFGDLSPEVKETTIKVAGFVALAGPIIYMTGKVISLARAFTEISIALKAVIGFGSSAAAAILAVVAAESHFSYLNPVADRFGYANWVGDMAAKKSGFTPKSSTYGQYGSLMPGQTVGGGSGFYNPAVSLKPPKGGGGGGGGGGGTPASRGLFNIPGLNGPPIVDLSGISPFEIPERKFDMSNIMPGESSSFGMNLIPTEGMEEFTTGLESGQQALEQYKSTWLSVGEAVSGAVSAMASAFQEGKDGFAAFGKAALMAAADIAKSLLVQAFMTAVKDSTTKAGLPGLIIGASLGIAAIGAIQGMIANIGTPKLAAGGLAYAPMQAIVGDNPNAHIDPEVISPLSKLKQLMGPMGGGNINVTGRIEGDDLLLVSSKAQFNGIRRGSGNVISF